MLKKIYFILICTMLICLNAKGMDYQDKNITSYPQYGIENELYSGNEFDLEDDYLTSGMPSFEGFEINNELNYDTLPDLQDLQNPLELQYQQNPEELEYQKNAFKNTPVDTFNNLGVYDDQGQYNLDFTDGVNILEYDNFLYNPLNNQMNSTQLNTPNNNTYKPVKTGIKSTGKRDKFRRLICHCPFCNHQAPSVDVYKHIKGKKSHAFPNFNYKTFKVSAQHTTENSDNTYTCNLCKETFDTGIKIIKHLLEHHKITVKKLKTNIENIPNIIENNKIKTPKPYKPRKYNRKKKNILPATLKPLIPIIAIDKRKKKQNTIDDQIYSTQLNIPNNDNLFLDLNLEDNKLSEPNKISKKKKHREKQSECKFEYTGKKYKNNDSIYFCPFCEYPSVKNIIIKHIKSFSHNCPSYNYSTFDHNAHHTIKNPDNTYTCNLCKKTFTNKKEIIKHLLEHHKITKEKLKTNIENIPNIIENNKIKTPKPYKPHKPKINWNNISDKIEKKNGKKHALCPFCPRKIRTDNLKRHVSKTHNLPNFDFYNFNKNDYHMIENIDGTYTCNLCKETFDTGTKIIKHLLEHHKITIKKLKTTIENIPNIIKNNNIRIPKPYKPRKKYNRKKKNILPATFKPIVPVIAMNKTNKKRKASEIYSQDGFTQSENPNENRPRKRRRF